LIFLPFSFHINPPYRQYQIQDLIEWIIFRYFKLPKLPDLIRNKLKKQGIVSNPDFKVRGSANTRIEALSDAVFAISIALMLISSSIPEHLMS